LEPTGKYFKHLASHLKNKGFRIRIIPGLYTSRAKYLLNNSALKTDAIDARVIADLVAQGKGWDFRDQEQAFEELRRLSFIYSKLWLDRNIQQNRLHCCIDQVFPELTMVLDVRRRTLREVLKKYQRPEEICAAGEAAFCDFVWQVSRGTEKRAKEVFALASESIGQSSLADIQEMSIALRNLDTLEADFEDVESQMEAWLTTIDYGQVLTTIPGIGTLMAANLIGQMGDLRGYKSVQQVYKMAGLNLVEYSSGKMKGRSRISKHGKAMVRRLLWPSACLVAKPIHPLHSWYQDQIKHKPKKVVFISCVRKILRWVYGVAKSGQPFDKSRLNIAH
jgi:transposase